MRQTDLSAIRAKIFNVTKRSPVRDSVADVVLEDADPEDGSVIRVLIELKSLKGISDNQLLELIGSIEESVLEVDDRYPSVRFSEAA